MRTEKILSELKKVVLERVNRRRTEGEDRLEKGRGERRRGEEDVVDEHWADVMGYGKTYREVYRDDQQHCEWIKTVASKFQNFLRGEEEKTGTK